MSSRTLSRAPPAPRHPSPPNTPQPRQGRPIATTAPPALVAVPPPARSEVVPVDPAPVEEENWDPEPEEQDPATITDEPIIDIEGDDDSNDLGLLDPNAPDETKYDQRMVNLCEGVS